MTTLRPAAMWSDSSILVIDDSLANVVLFQRILESVGMTNIRGITDPREAVTAFHESHPDIILLDLHMPHLDGFAVMRQLGELIPDDDFIPIIVLTGDVSTEARERALSAGAKDFVTKPLNAAEVVLRVANLLESRALYRGLRQHNVELAAQLMEREANEERRAAQWRERVDQVKVALAEGTLSMAFQPIVELRTGTVVGVEALSRFNCDPPRTPDVWFSEAAAVGLGVQLELHAMRTALATLARLPREMFLSVNLSPEAASDPAALELVTNTNSSRTVVEITEHTRIADTRRLSTALDSMRAGGARVAVDDTGAGFAGLHQILDLRPEVIKLDLGITRRIDADPVRRALASCLLTFAREIGAVIIAEGVETEAELSVLRGLGITLGQGYFLARPGPLDAISRQLPSTPWFEPTLDLPSGGL